MLSKTSIVILGMLARENLSAYDILKKIHTMDMKYWFPIGDTTLYETAIRLEKKGYIKNSHEHHGKQEKTIYTLTESGRQVLIDALCTIFTRIDYDTVWFCLATIYCTILDPQVRTSLIQKRRELLNEYEHGTTEKWNAMQQAHVPFQAICAVQRMLQIIKMEQVALTTLEQEFE